VIQQKCGQTLHPADSGRKCRNNPQIGGKQTAQAFEERKLRRACAKEVWTCHAGESDRDFWQMVKNASVHFLLSISKVTSVCHGVLALFLFPRRRIWGPSHGFLVCLWIQEA
jgi:hypothetical protein